MKLLCIQIPRKPKSAAHSQTNPPHPGQLSRRPSFRARYNSHQQLRRRSSLRLLDHRDAYAPSPAPAPKRKMSAETLSNDGTNDTNTRPSKSVPVDPSTEMAASSSKMPKPTSRSPSLRRAGSGTAQKPVSQARIVPSTKPEGASHDARPRLRLSAIIDLAQANDADTMSWALWEVEREIRNGQISASDQLPGLEEALEIARSAKQIKFSEARGQIRKKLQACGYETVFR